MNARYRYKRCSPYNQKRKKHKDNETKGVQQTYTFNEKIYIKNICNYEKAISGKKQKKYDDDTSTFDYKIDQPDFDKNFDGFDHYELSEFNYKTYENSGKKN